MNHTATTLAGKIESRTATVGIIGLGYVGLPLAIAFAEKGFPVLGFDVDPAKIEAIARGESYIRHLDGGRLASVVREGRLTATSDFLRLDEPDAILICVPTPLTPQREPDMSYVEKTARQIKPCLRPGQLVVLESTTYPGTTDELLRGILEESGLRAGEDFFLAFSPEREDPGNPDYGTTTIPKVVGGVDPVSGDLAEALYAQAIARTVRVSSARAAEATKLMENIFRAVNIALVNELKVVYDAMGIDVWEVLDAAETKPFGFMRFNPGPGWGGHCLDGSEWVRVRGRGLAGLYRLEDLYRKLRDQCEGILTRQGLYLRTDGLEALAIDPGTGERGWYPVTTLYRGRYDGLAVSVAVEGNRKLTVTPEHPMLVFREGTRDFEIRPARDLRQGDRVPVLSDPAEPGCGHPVVDLLEVVPEAERQRVWVRPAQGSWDESSEAARRRHVSTRAGRCRIAPGFAAMPVMEMKTGRIDGHVYSLEVETAETFTATGGIGVHNCIPLDPFYLAWKAREYGQPTKFIELAGEVNVEMPSWVIGKLQLALNARGRPVKGSRVLVVGLAYKKDIDDPRESPSFELIERLLELGAEVTYHDPHIPVAPRMRSWPDLPPMESVPLTPETLAARDAVVIATAHSAVDWELVAAHAPLIVDTRGVYREPRPNVIKA